MTDLKILYLNNDPCSSVDFGNDLEKDKQSVPFEFTRAISDENALELLCDDSDYQAVLVKTADWKRLQAELAQVRNELTKSQLQLIQAEKLASLGQLASGVAHEVKSPLTSLQLGVTYIKNNPDAPPQFRDIAISEMTKAINRAEKIINEMVDFSGSGQLELQPTNLNELVKRSIRMMRHEFTAQNISLVENFNESIPLANADADKIEQVLIIFFNNASQAMGPGGTIAIGTEVLENSEDFYKSQACYGTLESGKHLVIDIRDYGTGIPEDKIERVFDAFFTTKAKGKGTGLGLSVASSILDMHSGAIGLNNEVDPPGLRVMLVLPLANETNVPCTTVEDRAG